MRIRTPVDLGALIRDRRTKLGLDQKALAEKVGVSRQWIVEVEKGKPRAEIGLLLRTIAALDLRLSGDKEASEATKYDRRIPTVDIDSNRCCGTGKRP